MKLGVDTLYSMSNFGHNIKFILYNFCSKKL